jgi:hypothetical protein
VSASRSWQRAGQASQLRVRKRVGYRDNDSVSAMPDPSIEWWTTSDVASYLGVGADLGQPACPDPLDVQGHRMPAQRVLAHQAGLDDHKRVHVLTRTVDRPPQVSVFPDHHYPGRHDRRRSIPQSVDRFDGVEAIVVRPSAHPADVRLIPVVDDHVHLRLGHEPTVAHGRIGTGQGRSLDRADDVNRCAGHTSTMSRTTDVARQTTARDRRRTIPVVVTGILVGEDSRCVGTGTEQRGGQRSHGPSGAHRHLSGTRITA